MNYGLGPPLARAGTFIEVALKHSSTPLTCAQYRQRRADQRRRLSDLVPEDGALPDDQWTTMATTWSLSISLADELLPARLARLWILTSNRDGRGRPAAEDDRILRLRP